MISIEDLKKSENKAILEGLAMMSYLPSIGRVFEKGGVTEFQKIMANHIPLFEGTNTRGEFDDLHGSIIKLITDKIQTSKGKTLSYGQAQKPLNVFLKVYIDWSGKPNLTKASQLRKLLHVPLDSILMKEIKGNFPTYYEKYVVSAYDRIRENFRKVLEKKGETLSEAILRSIINPSNFSIANIISKDMYYAWQNCFRSIYPEKPILLDVLWSIKRRN